MTTVGFNSTPIKDNKDFVQRIFKCVEGLYNNHNKYPVERQVPFDLIVAMAAYESAWGQSRFAKEGNNFFGIRTWDLDVVPHMKAKEDLMQIGVYENTNHVYLYTRLHTNIK